MCDSLLNPSELKFLWKRRGEKNYDLKSLISNGTFIQYMEFEDLLNHRKVLGKIVTSPREGEAYHWPRLQHENLAPLIDTVSINEKISVYILPIVGTSLKNTIHVTKFMSDSECFNRKRAYTEDILWALDYLHNKSLCLMNLTELTIKICSVSDKAIICDFSHLLLTERATKEKLALPALYQAPELKTEYFDPVSAETWACGVMLLQIFTKHYLPSAFIGEEVHQVLQAIKEINYDIVKEANPGAELDFWVIEDLREFLGLFLVEDPKQRVNIRCAATSSFLRSAVKDHISKEPPKSESNFEQHWNSYHEKWINSYSKNKEDPVTFKDMYLKEIANCRANLKKLPFTNTVINLDFLPGGDSSSKNLEKTEQSKSTKLSNGKFVLLEHETQNSPKLCTVENSEKSVRGPKETPFECSKCIKNDLFIDFINNTNSLNLEHMPNFRGTENADKYDNGSLVIQKKDCEDKSPTNSTSGGNEIQCLDSKSQSLHKDNISMDSIESSENINKKEQLVLQNTLSVSDLSSHDDEYTFHGTNTPKHDKKEKAFFTNIICSKSEIIESNTSLSTKSTTAQNTAYFRPRDSSIDHLKDTKESANVFHSSALTSFCTQWNENHSNKITILDRTKLNENLNDGACYDYGLKCYGIKMPQSEQKLTKTLVPEIKNSNYSELFTIKSYPDTAREKSWKKAPDSQKNDRKFGDSDFFKIDADIRVTETKTSPISKILNQMHMNYKFVRRNSYRQAISQGLATHETDNAKKEKNPKAGRFKLLKTIFSNNRASSSMEENKVKTNGNCKNSKHILPIRNILTDGDSIQSLPHSSLEYGESFKGNIK